ncbi:MULTISPECIES: FAD-binding oxidoreductase [unclassified Minwuia]|jgi:glycine/D-amino acid oxidase-like deaminating enzyme|uniref:NAD(P)/FAD-dependent oxidoreductase n=1 Tax=unclassified Minwuia TaxID=2618799 RepID=UPI002478C6D9|nr:MULTISPECIES: FAD-binding oxidoreductase [unclassified Minwuia]
MTTSARLKLADDLVFRPWWWDARKRHAPPEPEMPARADVAIVGGGYTGLSAALTAARGGAKVVVFDAEDPGDGASTRNGGMVGDRLKPSFPKLEKTFGSERAKALMAEPANAVDYVERLILDLGIDCDFGRMGRYYPAVNPAHFRAMETALAAEQAARGDIGATMVSAEEQAQFLASPLYAGGRVQSRTGGLHPAKFHDGLMDAARNAGVTVLARTAVLGLEEEDDFIRLDTGLGYINADRVLICTNGYTGNLQPDLQRRVIPVTSAIAATEELDPALVERLIPSGRMITDSFNLLNYFRPSPDGRRILLGTRPGLFAAKQGPRLAQYIGNRIGQIFPELDGTRITHCWWGKVAFSFDHFPKIGMDERIGHALCYGGSGVAMSVWLGHKLGQKALGDLAGRTAFDDMAFPGRFYYRGWPWFLGPAMAWYGLQDRMAGRYRRAA